MDNYLYTTVVGVNMSQADGPISRRDALKLVGAGGIAGLAGCSGGGGGGGSSEFPELGNYPVEGDEVVFGFNVPQSG
ncbi:MAG: hypothetical protein A07HB70_02074, partial [uncultured archaeon A07HB70]